MATNHRNVSAASILHQNYQHMFQDCGCPATQFGELVSGVKLAKVVNALFFSSSNPVLTNQIITQNQDRKGNNVINFNMILKQIKNNDKVPFPDDLLNLSPFKLMDAEEEMKKLLNWLYQCWQSAHSPKFGKENYHTNAPHLEKNEHEGGHIIRNKKNTAKTGLLAQNYLQEEYDGMEMEPSEQDHVENKQENIFENVFFLDRDVSPSKKQELNDSLDMSEKVSKKGSFKIIRPKTSFSNAKTDENTQEPTKSRSPEKAAHHFDSFDGNKSKQMDNERYYSDDKQETRKTIPKMTDRPPLYKKIQKSKEQPTKNQNRNRAETNKFKQPAPFEAQQFGQKDTFELQVRKTNPSKYENLSKQINDLQLQIRKQASCSMEISNINQKSSQLHSRNATLPLSTKHKSQRKLFKIEIAQLEETEKQNIVAWLISINLLNNNATAYYDKFHEICKNGVIFPEIVNHHIGRSGQLSYFKNPVKSAEVHSNYQKVFSYLKQLPNFNSELLFMYDYFVPEAFESAFWSLLKSCFLAFARLGNKHSKTFDRESKIKEKLQSSSKEKPVKQSSHQSLYKLGDIQNSAQYQKIKYGRSDSLKKSLRKSSLKQENQKVEQVEKDTKSKRKASLDFIKDLPESNCSLRHEGLVQVEEPIEIKSTNIGYKELHELKKSHNTSSFINTPKKQRVETSASRSRIISTSSASKPLEKIELPSISLEMEMKAVSYLKQKGLTNNRGSMQQVTLFQDEIRNGTLINKILHTQLKQSYKYTTKPRNIIDCKQNFTTFFTQAKQNFVLIPPAYQAHFENIIKGEFTLFYGLVWHVSIGNKIDLGIKDLRNQSAILNISKNYYLDQELTQKGEENIMFWVKELQQDNQSISQLRIRDYNSLSASICCQNLLYKIATAIMPEKYTLKPTYEHPINQLEQQSNMKKILSYYAHNKVLRSDLAWKSKSLVKRQKTTTLQVLRNLMNYSKNAKKQVIPLRAENPIVSFVKYTRPASREDTKSDRNNDRLETTMANNSFAAKKKDHSVKKDIHPIIEVPWVRSLGFSGDLSLNNGIILCRLICRLTMKTLNFNQNPTSKAECLTNIRKAIKLIDKFKWDEQDIASADEKLTYEVYRFLKDKYKHSYAMKQVSA